MPSPITIDVASVHAKTPSYEISADNKGRHCRFFKIDNTTGLKLYDILSDAESSFYRQRKACELGVAPKVGVMVIDEARKVYGYTTELATIAKERGCCGTTMDDEKHPHLVHIYSKLIEYGYVSQACDLFEKNWGYLPSGNIVCVDFGP